MDDLDRDLIALLRADARAPLSTLAARLGVSRATVKSRIERLRADGVIQDFTITLGREVPDAAIRAVTLVEVEGRQSERVSQRLLGFPEVTALHATNGRWDLIVELETSSLTAFDETLRRLREIDGVTGSETHIKLATRRARA